MYKRQALYTGLRKGELLALTWEDIDYDKKLLNVNKSRTGTVSYTHLDVYKRQLLFQGSQ